MIRLQIETELPKLAQGLMALAQKQLPYGTALALTRVAGDAVKNIVDELGKTFTLRNKFVIRSIRRVKANKKDFPLCYSEVGSVQDFLKYHVTGGEKRPKGKLDLTLPTQLSRPTRTATISRSMWLSNLLKDKRQYQVVKSASGSSLLLYQTKSGRRRNRKRGQPYKKKHHTGKRGWKRETVYVLRDHVNIPARLDMVSCCEKALKEKFETTFYEAMKEAVESAKG